MLSSQSFENNPQQEAQRRSTHDTPTQGGHNSIGTGQPTQSRRITELTISSNASKSYICPNISQSVSTGISLFVLRSINDCSFIMTTCLCFPTVRQLERTLPTSFIFCIIRVTRPIDVRPNKRKIWDAESKLTWPSLGQSSIQLGLASHQIERSQSDGDGRTGGYRRMALRSVAFLAMHALTSCRVESSKRTTSVEVYMKEGI